MYSNIHVGLTRILNESEFSKQQLHTKMKQRASILLTGGTGSFGSQFVPMTLKKYDPETAGNLLPG